MNVIPKKKPMPIKTTIPTKSHKIREDYKQRGKRYKVIPLE